MAKEVTVNIKADSKQAVKSVDQLNKKIDELKDNTSAIDGKKMKAIDTGARKSSKGVKFLGNSFKSLGTAIKAAGIGLIIAAVVKLGEAFTRNQKFMDGFNVAMESISMVADDFVSFIVDNFGTVVDYFKDVFENPVENIKAFGKAIKDNLIERFESFIDTLGFLAEGVKSLFTGDFDAALTSFQKAGKESVDVFTGVNNAVDKVAKGVKTAGKAIGDYGKKVKQTAKSIVELEKAAKINKAINDGLIEQYDVQAEKLRQTRDDETLTFKERREANEKLAGVLEEQGKVMKENAQTAVDLAKARLKQNNNVENQVALQEALNEQAAIEARVTGQLSEQKTNAVALDKEQAEVKKELAKINKKNRELALIESQQTLDQQIIEINKTVENEKEKHRLIEEAKKAHVARMNAYDDDVSQKKKDEATKKKEEELKRLAEEEERKRQLRQQTLDDLARVAGEETKIGKALLLVKALLNAKEQLMELKNTIFYKKESAKRMITNATEATVNSTTAIAEGTAQTAKVGFPQNIPMLVAYAAQAAGILATVKTAVDAARAAGGGGGSTGVGALSPSAAARPQFNVVGTSNAGRIEQAISGQTEDLNNRPIRTYVVASDVTTNQALDRQVESEASI